MIPIIARHARAWPRYEDAPPAEYLPIAEALTRRFDDDAHTAGYSVPTILHRLDKGAIDRVPVQMVALIVDVDGPNHKRTPEWDDAEAPKIEKAVAAGAYFYGSSGGYKLVWRLAEPFNIATKHDAARWSASYIAALDDVRERFGIVGDTACKSWPHIFRLPFVVRDGVPQQHEAAGLATMGAWPLRVVEPPAVNSNLTTVATFDDSEPPSDALIAHVRAKLKAHGPAIEGEGGDDHTYQACAIVCRDYALPDDVACELLEEWNATCVPPWDGDGLRAKMDNAYNYAQGDVGERRSGWECEQRIARGLERSLSRQVAAPTSTVRAEPAGAPSTTAIALPTVPAVSEREEYGDSLVTFLGEDDPGNDPDAWIIQGVVPAGVPAIIGGHPKSCKTFLAEHIAICAAAGIEWRRALRGEISHTAKRARVLVLAREDSMRETRRRIWRLSRGLGLDPRSLVEWLRVDSKTPFYFDKTEDVERMRRTLDRWRPALVIVDSLSRTHTGDENSKKEMSIVTATWGDLCQEYDLTVAPIHHFTKTGEGTLLQKLRGSGDIGALVRHIIGVEKQADGRTEISFDGNLHPLPEPFLVRMLDAKTDDGKECIRFEDAGSAKSATGCRIDDAILTELREAMPSGLTAREIERHVRGNNDAIRERRKWLVTNGHVRFDQVIKRFTAVTNPIAGAS